MQEAVSRTNSSWETFSRAASISRGYWVETHSLPGNHMYLLSIFTRVTAVQVHIHTHAHTYTHCTITWLIL